MNELEATETKAPVAPSQPPLMAPRIAAQVSTVFIRPASASVFPNACLCDQDLNVRSTWRFKPRNFLAESIRRQRQHLAFPFGAHALTEPPCSVDRGPAIAGLLGGSRRNQRTTVDRRENSDGSRSAMTPPPANKRLAVDE